MVIRFIFFNLTDPTDETREIEDLYEVPNTRTKDGKFTKETQGLFERFLVAREDPTKSAEVFLRELDPGEDWKPVRTS